MLSCSLLEGNITRHFSLNIGEIAVGNIIIVLVSLGCTRGIRYAS